MSLTGKWNGVLESPMGKQKAGFELVESDGKLTGSLTMMGSPTQLEDGWVDGNKLGWKVRITSPMSMSVVFALQLEGDSVMGTAKPGILPATKFSGSRADSDSSSN